MMDPSPYLASFQLVTLPFSFFLVTNVREIFEAGAESFHLFSPVVDDAQGDDDQGRS